MVDAGIHEIGARRIAVVDLGPHRDDRALRIARGLLVAVEAAVEVADDAECLALSRAVVDPVLEHGHLSLERPAVGTVAGEGIAVA